MNKDLLISKILDSKINEEPIFQSDIDKLQKDFNVKLPQDYVDFLLKTNGGQTDQTIFYYNGIEYALLFFNSIQDIKDLIDGEFYLIPNGTIPIAIVDGND